MTTTDPSPAPVMTSRPSRLGLHRRRLAALGIAAVLGLLSAAGTFLTPAVAHATTAWPLATRVTQDAAAASAGAGAAFCSPYGGTSTSESRATWSACGVLTRIPTATPAWCPMSASTAMAMARSPTSTRTAASPRTATASATTSSTSTTEPGRSTGAPRTTTASSISRSRALVLPPKAASLLSRPTPATSTPTPPPAAQPTWASA